MAIIKEIELDNGVIVKYHRVVSVNNVVNQKSIIEIASYTSKEKREEEKQHLENKTNMNIFISGRYINLEYEKTLDVDSAYSYIKTLPEFSDSIDD